MKRTVIILVTLLFVASPLFAAAVTDSVKPLGHLKWSASVEDNYLFKRTIKKPENRDTFKYEKMNQIYGKAAVGLTPYFNVYAKLGASDSGKIKDDNLSTGNNLEIETKYGFLWALGVSGAREFGEGFKVGADVQFNWWQSDIDSIKDGSSGSKATGVSGKIRNYEIQGTPFISKKLEFPESGLTATPYFGVKFSYFKTETDSDIKYNSGGDKTDSWSLRGQHYVGLVVGSDLTFAEKWALQVEGRFLDETAIAGGLTYRF